MKGFISICDGVTAFYNYSYVWRKLSVCMHLHVSYDRIVSCSGFAVTPSQIDVTHYPIITYSVTASSAIRHAAVTPSHLLPVGPHG
jgi:hypothetical protein